jgi:hypothetical protein
MAQGTAAIYRLVACEQLPQTRRTSLVERRMVVGGGVA